MKKLLLLALLILTLGCEEEKKTEVIPTIITELKVEIIEGLKDSGYSSRDVLALVYSFEEEGSELKVYVDDLRKKGYSSDSIISLIEISITK